jgi:rare lipoprotein A
MASSTSYEAADYVAPVAYKPAPVAPQPREETRTYTYSAPAPAADAGDYFVQIGSFTDISNAQTLSNRVQASLPVTIVPARVNGADYFRVRVGPLLSRSEAERARNDLSYAGISQGRIVVGE